MDNIAIQELKEYDGNNPYLVKIYRKVREFGIEALTEQEYEYAECNLKMQPYKVATISVTIGEKTLKHLQELFNTDKQISEVRIDRILGETSTLYHVGYGVHNFFIFKEDVPDLYMQIYRTSNVDFNFIRNQSPTIRLEPEQEDTVSFLSYIKKGFVFDTAGLGKTFPSICAKFSHKAKKVLVVCLASKKIEWKRDIQKFGQTCQVINGRSDTLDGVSDFTVINFENLAYYCKIGKKASSEILNASFDYIIIDEVQKIRSKKTNVSKAFRKLTQSSTVKYISALSATPFQRLEEFYNICSILNIDVENLFLASSKHFYLDVKASFEQFIIRYCSAFKIPLKPPRKPFWKRGADRMVLEFRNRARYLFIRRKTQDVIKGFPKLIDEQIWFELSGRQVDEYKNLYKNYALAKNKILIDNICNSSVATIRRNIVKTCKGMIKLWKSHYLEDKLKIMQSDELIEECDATKLKLHIEDYLLTSKLKEKLQKMLYDYFKEEISEDNINNFIINSLLLGALDAKIQSLVETTRLRQYLAIQKVKHTVKFVKEELAEGRNCLIATNYIEEFEKIASAFDDEIIVKVKSGLNGDKKQALLDEFNKNPKKTIMLGHVSSIGTGLNITKADTVIANSPFWNYDSHEQLRGRSWRRGRKDTTYMYTMIFSNTMEEFDVSETSKLKSEIATKFLDG